VVKGLGLFTEHFRAFNDQYILIGGTACDLALGEAGIDFRVTRDLDIVLCAEALTLPFVETFWTFIQAGGYEIQQRAGGAKQFYRFKKPEREEYPYMLELFSRVPDGLDHRRERHLVSVPVEEEVVSLSAILLDDEYYTWIQNGKLMLHDVSIVDPEHIIPLKARACLDLLGRETGGERVDGRDIKKHRNDVFRLLAVIGPEPNKEVPDSIKRDLRDFLAAIHSDEFDFKVLGLGKRKQAEVFEILRAKYQL
jgi:hypothetical protein